MLLHAARIGAGIAVLLGLVAGLSGCATMLDVAGVERAGHQSDGTYVVSAEEERLACRQIRERLDVLGREIAALPAQAAEEKQSGPRTVGAAFGRMFGGPGSGLQSVDSYRKATAENDALYALYVRKGCV